MSLRVQASFFKHYSPTKLLSLNPYPLFPNPYPPTYNPASPQRYRAWSRGDRDFRL
jgi:hypothetical protein